MPHWEPPTGHPDGEDRPLPHGALMFEGTTVTASAGGTTIKDNVNFTPVAAYRSLVVAIKNSGAFPCEVKPHWEFYSGASALSLTETQVVPAGQSRRLLFQNQGDLLVDVKVTGVGGDTTISYYIAPSNLDPFSTSVKFLSLVGVNAGVQTVPVGAGGAIAQLQESGTVSYIPSPELFSFDYAAAGIIETVHILHEGLYGISARLEWVAPTGAYTKEMTLVAVCSPPVGNQSSRATIHFDATETWAHAHVYLAVSAAAATVAGNLVRITAVHGNGVGVLVQSAKLEIVQLASRCP